MVCGDFILPESANYVSLFCFLNLRNLLYLIHYRTDWPTAAVESGDINDYNASDRILGNIHCAQSVGRFVEYVKNTFGDAPGLMFKYTAENCLAIDSRYEGNSVTIVYEDAPVDVEVIFDDPNDSLSHTIVPGSG